MSVDRQLLSPEQSFDHSDAATTSLRSLLSRVEPDEIPASADLYSADALADALDARRDPPHSVLVVGDIMLGGRTRRRLAEHGRDYPFGGVLPLLRRSPIVVGNLEGPLARQARCEDRRYSYKVDPALAEVLARAGVNVVTLANNHLVDCGRAGVIETLDALKNAGVEALGAGVNERCAHAPVIRRAGRWRVGLLGYYWNRRCAATATLPGSAMDPPEALAADIRALRQRVDRIVVNFHWGVPYERAPSSEDRAKARYAIDCGADVVVGHHPHVVQPFEIHRGRPILYSVGNFTFGSGNSRAEGLAAAVRFEEGETVVEPVPLYVKNRDPRVNYQPKVMRGAAAERVLRSLAAMSGESAAHLTIAEGRGRIVLPVVSPNVEATDV
jgi:poly-gamma-glutamate capsule biosynthesis protein CapA/YwtB (metallophosphatase superfamily)